MRRLIETSRWQRHGWRDGWQVWQVLFFSLLCTGVRMGLLAEPKPPPPPPLPPVYAQTTRPHAHTSAANRVMSRIGDHRAISFPVLLGQLVSQVTQVSVSLPISLQLKRGIDACHGGCYTRSHGLGARDAVGCKHWTKSRRGNARAQHLAPCATVSRKLMPTHRVQLELG